MMDKVLLPLIMLSNTVLGVTQFPVDLFQDHVGNGGKGVVCRGESDEILSAELLDFYESKILYNLDYDLPGDGVLNKVKSAIMLMLKLDEVRMDLYLELHDQFMENTKFVPSPLSDTGDSDHILDPPEGCTIEQFAIQINPQFPRDKRYNINRNLWNALDDSNKAGLILHEIIYYEGILRGHRNSMGVRYLNAYLASQAISDLSQDEYDDILFQTKLLTKIWRGNSSGEWSYISTVNVGWLKARKACHELISATLPTPELLQLNDYTLINSPLGPFIRQDSFAETWTKYRRPEDGKVAIGQWKSDNITIHFRRHDDSASVICHKSQIKELL